jgi:hypothetical protein
METKISAYNPTVVENKVMEVMDEMNDQIANLKTD